MRLQYVSLPQAISAQTCSEITFLATQGGEMLNTFLSFFVAYTELFPKKYM
jgi:hypothetical protein